MEPTLLSALNVTIVGIGTVFVALSSMVGALMIMDRLVNGPREPAQPVAAAPAAAARPAAPALDLRAIALAAFAMHQNRRVSVRAPEKASPWGTAAKMRSIQRYPKHV